MKNAELADIFNRMADLMEMLDENRFRIVSYRRAAVAMEGLTEDIEAVAARGGLADIPGVGESTAEKIEQYLKTGKITRYEELVAKCPPGLVEMMHVPGMGPKTAMKLWKELGIASLDQLRQVLRDEPGKVSDLKGLGEKKVAQIKESLEQIGSTQGRVRLGAAREAADELLAMVRATEGVTRAMAAGSLRRGRETVGDIDLLCEAPAGQGQRIVDAFVGSRQVARVLAQGPTKGSVLLARGVQADLRVVARESFGAALMYFTGSKDHNVRVRELAVKRGWKLNEYGIFDGERRIAGEDEEGIYAALGLQWIPPEMREASGELALAAEHKLPRLVELADIRGDFHTHTTASDGVNSIDEMIQAARARGYTYLCISDHSKGQVQAHGLDEKRLLAHVRAIHEAGKRYDDITVLAGCEVDIKKDGTLDFADEILAQLDLVTASVHAALTMKGPEATERLVRAIGNPHVHVIGHPTGRIVGGRAGIEIDIDAVARAAAAHKVALEVNADDARLDLRDTHVRAALAAGAKIAICSDAHSVGSLAQMEYGVLTARRGWARAADVVNTLSTEKLRAWLRKK